MSQPNTESTMAKQKALAKIRKCLALAASDNPHEAARAMAQAQKLMQEHGVSDTDIELADVSEVARKAASVTAIVWDAALALLVADAFGCKSLRATGKRLQHGLTFKRYANWVFVGIGSATEVAAYAYEVLVRQCAKARRHHMAEQSSRCKPATRTARGDAFALGWVKGVSDLVSRLAGSTAQDARIATYMQQRWPEMTGLKVKDRAAGRNVKLDSRMAGYSQGRNAQLHGAVGGIGEVLRIGGGA